MPLSEDEQRILSEIEAQLYESDPALAKEVSSTTVYTHSLRTLRWSTLGFVVGVAVMVFTLSISFWFAFVGFLIMLACALLFERSARQIGKVGIQQVTQRARSADNGAVRDYLKNPGERLRDRMRRERGE